MSGFDPLRTLGRSPIHAEWLGALCLTSCSRGQSPTDAGSVIRAYQLCAKSGDARAKLNEIAKAYAAERHALLSDRGPGAQNELVAMKSDVLHSTSLPVVLLTIDKPSAFRISITNVGLNEKFALSVRVWDEGDRGRYCSGCGRNVRATLAAVSCACS
jgi:hypothetical protein